MAFRKEKGADPFSQKTNRYDRFAQMSKQEEMIEQKKREIQAKLQAQKRKEAEDAMKKLSTSNLNKPGAKKPFGKPLNLRAMTSQLKQSNNVPSASASVPPLNIFSNDGSFMDQFKKLSGVKDGKQVAIKREDQKQSALSSSQDGECRSRDSDDKDEDRRRDRDKDRTRERDWDYDRESGRERDRYREHDRSADRSRDRSRGRSRDRSRERSRDRSLERSRDSSRDSSCDSPRDRSSDRSRGRSRDGSSDRSGGRSRDRSLERSSDRSRDRMHDRPLDRIYDRSHDRCHDKTHDRPHERDRDGYRNRREDRWQNNSEPPRSSSPYSPTKQDYCPSFPTMYPPPNMSLPPPNTMPPSSQPTFSQPTFSQPPPSQTFISYPTVVHSTPQPSQAQPPPIPLQAVPPPSVQIPSLPPHSLTLSSVPPPSVAPPSVPHPSVPPPSVPPPSVPPPPISLQMIPQPSPIQPHSIPPPSPLDPHLIPPPPMPPTGLPPPGMLPPQFQQHPPAIPRSLSHLSGIPPPLMMSSFPPLPVMPVPPPISTGGVSAAQDVKPVDPGCGSDRSILVSTEASAPSSVSRPSIPPSVAVTPVLAPSNNGSITQLPVIKKEEGTFDVNDATSEQNDAVLHLARMVSQCGDDIEDIIKMRNADDANLWFLHQKDSEAYRKYRQKVEELRQKRERAEDGDDEGDSIEGFNRRKVTIKRECVTPDRSREDNKYEVNDYGTRMMKGMKKEDELKHVGLVNNGSQGDSDDGGTANARKRKRRSRWAPEDTKVNVAQLPLSTLPPTNVPPPGYQGLPAPGIVIPGMSNAGPPPLLSKLTRSDPALVRYAVQAFGTSNLSDEDWKKAEDHYKINLLYQDLLRKREEIKNLEMKGKHKYEYDSDEEIEGGTWEHRLRAAEMEATERWADELTKKAQGKHHIGDFLPPDELARFMEKYSALKEDREPDLSDYKEFKLKEDNIGFQMLQKLGWSEGQGLGSDGSGIVDPVNRATTRSENHGLGIDRPDEVSKDDDEFEAYRKRMMLAYRFRPNPLNNPRRPYY